MVVWYISTVLRVVALFLCMIEKESYRLLLPISQVLHMAHIVIFEGSEGSQAQIFIQYSVIFIVTPIVLYSKLKFSIICSILSTVLTFGIVQPTLKGLNVFSLIIGVLVGLFSVFLLLLYDKFLFKKCWEKIKHTV